MRLLFVLLIGLSAAPARAAPSLDRLTLPKGFHVEVYSDQVPQARELAVGAKSTVFVGSMDADHDGSLLVSDDQAGAVYRVTYGR